VKKAVSEFAIVLLLVVAHVSSGYSCSFGHGYFQQVTSLKGTIVGRNLHRFGPVQYIRWLRQSYKVSAADLELYKYEWPIEDHNKLVQVARVTSDSNGNFDFGESIPEGHYFLVIAKGEWSDSFDVEITGKVKKTKSVTIDISPVYPDCKGGHELVVYN
jgi:hypothetical protein